MNVFIFFCYRQKDNLIESETVFLWRKRSLLWIRKRKRRRRRGNKGEGNWHWYSSSHLAQPRLFGSFRNWTRQIGRVALFCRQFATLNSFTLFFSHLRLFFSSFCLFLQFCSSSAQNFPLLLKLLCANLFANCVCVCSKYKEAFSSKCYRVCVCMCARR